MRFPTNLIDLMENMTMNPSATLDDPWNAIVGETPEAPRDLVSDAPRDLASETSRDGASDASPSAACGADPSTIPPVRTIVVDRPPMPVAPQSRREALRSPAGAGPERLSLRDVSIYYGAKRAVSSVSLSIRQGEVLALIGPSGCGKTSLLRTLNRLTELTPSAARSGEVLLDGEEVHALQDTKLRSRVAMVFQQPNPFPMSIFDNVAFALREQSRKRPRRRELEPLVIEALRRAGLYEEVGDDLDCPALRLSGGQQQRLCIARAIAPRPEVLLMDEPCSALDPISTSVIEDLIHELRRDLAVVIVTHNLAQAQRVADKVAFMYLGDLVEYGTAAEVFEEPRAERTREYVRGTFG
jgi:phosphate transport system ATP-binding protein